MATAHAADVRVVDVPERSRFEVSVGEEVAGYTEYRRGPGRIAFIHTLIDPPFDGRGLASELAQTALSQARAEGLAVLPFCPFVRGYIARHTLVLQIAQLLPLPVVVRVALPSYALS
jgi:predicted GNAT family acetyltransferase